jgi:hypothetical protein
MEVLAQPYIAAPQQVAVAAPLPPVVVSANQPESTAKPELFDSSRPPFAVNVKKRRSGTIGKNGFNFRDELGMTQESYTMVKVCRLFHLLNDADANINNHRRP